MKLAHGLLTPTRTVMISELAAEVAMQVVQTWGRA